jgi:actin related protein 2/3 complex subunit 2
METTPDEEFDVAVEFDCESLPDPDAFLEDISCLRMHCLGAPIYKAFNTAMGGTVTDTTVRIIKYRRSGHMFVIPRAEKTVIGFLLSFNDVTDRAMAKIYLTEFLETSRTVRSATTPGIMFTKNVPPDLEGVTIPSVSNEEISGYVLFSFEAKQMNDESRDRAIRTLTNFRVYLHYHIKASKTYLHMRMRRRVTNWMQILNRAKPDRDLETKNMKGKKLNAK